MHHVDRLVVALIGALYLAMATQLSPPYFAADILTDAPAAWEVIFTLAGGACLSLAATGQVWLRWLAGGLITFAAASRSVAVLVLALVDPNVSFLPALGWTLVLILQTVSWPVLAPRR